MWFTNVLKYLSLAAAFVAGWWNNMTLAWQILLIAMFFDVLSGAARALSQQKLNSTIAWSGIGKKALTIIIVSSVFLFGRLLISDQVAAPLGTAVIGYYTYVEALSILENSAAAGLPIPAFLKTALERLNPDKALQGDYIGSGKAADK
jgi:toxin secretion/phage lysis holin